MLVLELTFPTGRYHATPWGRHVNEGAVEWPPAPWRIIRALIATWHLKARNSGEISEGTARALFEALVKQQPTFWLPRATTAHTRHYMPYIEGKNEKTTKIFDTFVQLSQRDPVLAAWDIALPSDQLFALQILAERLGYFGRAESLVEARILVGVTSIQPNATPLDAGKPVPTGSELVRLLAPMSTEAYKAWLSAFKTPSEPSQTDKKGKSKKTTPKQDVPDDLFEALHADTGALQAAGWNLPPGAINVNYTRPENAFSPPSPHRSRNTRPLPTVARYSVISNVAPSITEAISIADRLHASLCKFSEQCKDISGVFTGLKNGKPQSEHKHAHIFCEANGTRAAITHITIWGSMGFDESACLALRKVSKLWGHGGHDIRLVLHGIGHPEDFKDCSLFGKARTWRALTPFVGTRHPKTYRDGRPKLDSNGRQIGSPEHDLLRLLALHPNGSLATVSRCDERQRPFPFGTQELRSLQFSTHRPNGGGARGIGTGHAFTITFPEPISGPIALGYGAHFGLGLFCPVPSAEP